MVHVPVLLSFSYSVIVVSDSEDDRTEDTCVRETVPRKRLRRVRVCSQRRSFLAASLLGIAPGEYRQLRRWNVPRDFLQVLAYSHIEYGWITPHLDVVEFMGGICNVIKAGNERGHACKGYEIENDSTFEDFLGAIGFMESIKLGKSTNYEALQHWDTVCTSWIWVCADKSKRSIARPMGDIDRPFQL